MRLAFPSPHHEADHRAIVQEFSDIGEEIMPRAMQFAGNETYEAFLQRIKDESEGKNLQPGRVPATLYFIVDDAGKVVGGEHIRHELNDALRFDAGNIGYGIRPSERRKGYATIGLKLALEKCKEMGMDKVLLTCDKDNIGSAKAMIKNGGILDSEYEFEGKTKQRYRIQIT